MSTQDEEWREHLKPFADKYWDLEQEMWGKMEQMPSDKVRAIHEATYEPTRTNCWWPIYSCREWVRKIARRVLIERGEISIGDEEQQEVADHE